MNTDNRETAINASSAAIGGAVGTAIGGPVGGFVGGALGVAAGDIFTRVLSAKERERVESVVNLAGQEISDRVQAGESLRPGLG